MMCDRPRARSCKRARTLPNMLCQGIWIMQTGGRHTYKRLSVDDSVSGICSSYLRVKISREWIPAMRLVELSGNTFAAPSLFFSSPLHHMTAPIAVNSNLSARCGNSRTIVGTAVPSQGRQHSTRFICLMGSDGLKRLQPSTLSPC